MKNSTRCTVLVTYVVWVPPHVARDLIPISVYLTVIPPKPVRVGLPPCVVALVLV